MNGAKIELFDKRLDALFSLRTPLLKALRTAGGTHTVGDVADMILRGAAQFFGDEKGACVTEVITYPRRRVLHVWLAFGELETCLGLIPQMEEFARANGMVRLSLRRAATDGCRR